MKVTREHHHGDRSVTWTWTATFLLRSLTISWNGPVRALHPDEQEMR